MSAPYTFRFTIDISAVNEARASEYLRWLAWNTGDDDATIRRVERQGQIADPIVSDGETGR